MKFSDKNVFSKDNITVEFFYKYAKEFFKLKLISKDKKGFDRLIKEQTLQRPQFGLAGFMDLFSKTRIQVFGNTEMRYLAFLDPEKRAEAIERIFKMEIPCIILMDKNKPFPEMLDFSKKYKVPIFSSDSTTTKMMYLISDFLDDQFALRFTLHGSLIDVYGVGMLFIGKSGIGKSEVALDLVERGHRLVADDVVVFTKKGEGILIGSGTELVKHFMEVRGIGLIDIKSIFGIRAIRFQKRLEVVIELEIWDDDSNYTRTGLDGNTINLCGVDLPLVKVPIVPGKNITVISEVIALNYLQKHFGYDAAEVFKTKLEEKLKNKVSNLDRSVDYFEHDFE